jgi:hypothetical protein
MEACGTPDSDIRRPGRAHPQPVEGGSSPASSSRVWGTPIITSLRTLDSGGIITTYPPSTGAARGDSESRTARVRARDAPGAIARRRRAQCAQRHAPRSSLLPCQYSEYCFMSPCPPLPLWCPSPRDTLHHRPCY